MNRALHGFLLGLGLWLLTGCRPAERPAFPLELAIRFTCDTHGRLVPCGCFTGQYGGMTRLKTALEAETFPLELRLDAGDAIGGAEDYHLLEYRQILRAYGLMKFDALNLGQREARLSAAQLRELKQSSPVPLISANLLDKSTRQPVCEPYRLLRRGACTIAVLGVVDPRGLGEELGEGLEVERMETVLAARLPELRAKADAIILLAFTDEPTMARLAREFYELDVILGGKVPQPAQKLTKENRSLIYFTTNESRALGLLRLRFEGKAAVAALANEIRLLIDSIPEDPAIQALAATYREEARRTRLAIDSPERLREGMVPGVRAGAEYAGSESCLECHAAAGRVWQKSGHARAFDTLRRKQADADPKCIGCHAIGFGTLHGYRREFGAGKLTHVGCESCHGPGSLHVRQQRGDRAVNFQFRPLGAGDCQQCHYGEFSRPFDWTSFWTPIAHGLEEGMKKKG